MVNLTSILLGATKSGTGKGHQQWIDSLRVYCKAGYGGNGLPSYGGIGGKGGDIIIQCKEENSRKSNKAEVKSLAEVFFKAFRGDPKLQRLESVQGKGSSKSRLVGAHGADTIFQVPQGVMVIDDDTKKLLKDLNKPGEKIVVASGGLGGSPRNDWIGTRGQQRFIRLDLKLLADVGLVGFPNSGKSTLLKAISRARPKIANYPFTTIKPNLGHIVYEDDREISIADLPGLIEGASYNIGMGHRFLKHVERTRLMLFIVDVNGFQLNVQSAYRSAFETLTLLNRELELYDPNLVSKPALCIVNKMDSEGSNEKYEEFLTQLKNRENEEYLKNLDQDSRPEKLIEFTEVVPMSAKFSPSSVLVVKDKLRALIDEYSDGVSPEDNYNRIKEQMERGLSVGPNQN